MFVTLTDYVVYFLIVATGGLSAVFWSELVSLYKRNRKTKKNKKENEKTDF